MCVYAFVYAVISKHHVQVNPTKHGIQMYMYMYMYMHYGAKVGLHEYICE